jgi:hypothetical protein
MKVLFFLLITNFAHAGALYNLSGQDAYDLIKTAESGGAFVDCFHLYCGTNAEYLKCTHNEEAQQFNCNFKAQSKTGEMIEMKNEKDDAKLMMKMLVKAGFEAACKNKICTIRTGEVSCGYSNGGKPQEDAYCELLIDQSL